MEKIESIERLKQMKSRPWVYRNKVVEIIGYADGVGEDGDEVEIYLNDGTMIECRIIELSKKLKEFKDATGTVVVLANHRLDKVSSMQPGVMQELRDTVMETIRGLKQDPGKVNQAKQVFQGVNTMINLARTELEYRRYMEGTVPNGKR